jgi:hypothetical protein
MAIKRSNKQQMKSLTSEFRKITALIYKAIPPIKRGKNVNR